MGKIKLTILFVFISNVLVGNVFAKDKKLIEVKSIFEVQSQDAFESDNQSNEYVDSFARNENYIRINITNNLRLDSAIIFDRINAEDANGQDRSFDGEGIYTEELKLTFEKDNFEVFAGKFNPNYGTAFNIGRGIWSHELARNYEQTEKLGFGSSYGFKKSEILGKVRVEASLFHNDAKVLDGSTISHRSPKVVRNDSTPGNNNDLGSFVFSINGEDPLIFKNLKYHLAYLHLRNTSNGSDNKNQTGFVTNLSYIYDLNKDISFDLLLETSKFSNFSGINTYERDIHSANIITKIKEDFRITLAFSELEDESVVLNDTDTTSLEFSSGYYFPQTSILKNFSIEAGLRSYKDSNNIKTESVGVLTRYILNF